MPNFRESDPSKIAVGLGGTVNLVAGLCFLLLTLALIAYPWHVLRAWAGTPTGPLPRGPLPVVLGVIGGLILGALAVVLPLRAGVRALRRMEF
jgi:ABC-2 type transport system permease protein